MSTTGLAVAMKTGQADSPSTDFVAIARSLGPQLAARAADADENDRFVAENYKSLEQAGLVKTKREGRYKFHFLDTTPLTEIVKRWSIKT